MEKSSQNKIYRAIGLMSGTAMDGIDAALIETDGYGYVGRVGFETQDYEPAFRQRMKDCLNKTDRDDQCLGVEDELTRQHIPIIRRLIKKFNLTEKDIDIIGFHGQTIHHDPDRGLTVQLGDGDMLAVETGIDVVYDLRAADMKNGGQGAPFLPVYHRALAMRSGLDCPVVIANIGGVSNITWIAADGDMVAFDTGPGNAMIDDWMQKQAGKKYDENGAAAAQGKIDGDMINAFLSLEYLLRKYPKSLDRNDFNQFNVDGMTVADGAATLTEMTVQAIAAGIRLCPQPPKAVYVTGGGRRNHYMMRRLREVAGCSVESVDVLGWSGDSMEAEGFAYMAVRRLLGEPVSFPGTTGCRAPTVGGVLIPVKAKAA